MKKTYFAGFDGIRAYAAFCVLIGHAHVFHPQQPSFSSVLLTRWDAVTLFFVLSGFLIGYLLIDEKRRTGAVDVGAFYKRRVFRILPLYYTSLILCGAVALIYPLSWSLLWIVVPFTANALIYTVGIPAMSYLGHFWSIAAEEQWYAIYPLVHRFILPIFFILLVGRWMLVYGSPAGSPLHEFAAYNRIEAMALGVLFAHLAHRGHLRLIYRLRWFWYALFVLLVAMDTPTMSPLYDLAAMILFACVLVNVPRGGVVTEILERQPLRALGKVSYGVYMWHLPLVYIFAQQLAGVPLYIMVTVTTLGLSFASYKYIEKPFLRMKDRLSKRQPFQFTGKALQTQIGTHTQG